MSSTLFKKELLRLFPWHRSTDKRAKTLSLDDLIDDYRRSTDISSSEFDFLMMAYRYEHIFEEFFKDFTQKKLKPEGLMDLWRLGFAALLTRKEENAPQLTHALVESSKKYFSLQCASPSNAFFRKALRQKESILADLEKNPLKILGPKLQEKWASSPELAHRFAQKIKARPQGGISALDESGSFGTHGIADFSKEKLLALSQGSFLWTQEIAHQASKMSPAPLNFLDMCAAPGGKLIAFKKLFHNKEIRGTAVDSKFKRLERLKENLLNWEMSDSVTVVLQDWNNEDLNEKLKNKFDLIFVDLPCTGLGTLATRPDLLLNSWDEREKDIFLLQESILKKAFQLTNKNARIFVSVCSSDPSEIQHLSKILSSAPNFAAQLDDLNTEEITGWVIIKE